MYVGSMYLISEWIPISLKWDLIYWYIHQSAYQFQVPLVKKGKKKVNQCTNLLLKVHTDVTKDHVSWCISCIRFFQMFLKMNDNINRTWIRLWVSVNKNFQCDTQDIQSYKLNGPCKTTPHIYSRGNTIITWKITHSKKVKNKLILAVKLRLFYWIQCDLTCLAPSATQIRANPLVSIKCSRCFRTPCCPSRLKGTFIWVINYLD
jgi:hypothetical protein